MSRIDIRRPHSLSIAEARELAERIAGDLKQQFSLESEWDGDSLRFSRQGVDGALTVTKKEVRIEAQLGLLLAFLKPQIENHIQANLNRIFESPARARKAPKPAAASAERSKHDASGPKAGSKR